MVASPTEDEGGGSAYADAATADKRSRGYVVGVHGCGGPSECPGRTQTYGVTSLWKTNSPPSTAMIVTDFCGTWLSAE